MASKFVYRLIDDLDRGELPESKGEALAFGQTTSGRGRMPAPAADAHDYRESA